MDLREEIAKRYSMAKYGKFWDSPAWLHEGEMVADQILALITQTHITREEAARMVGLTVNGKVIPLEDLGGVVRGWHEALIWQCENKCDGQMDLCDIRCSLRAALLYQGGKVEVGE